MTNKYRNRDNPKSEKRILSVTIKTEIDDSPDTSYLGEYIARCKNEHTINRANYARCKNPDHPHFFPQAPENALEYWGFDDNGGEWQDDSGEWHDENRFKVLSCDDPESVCPHCGAELEVYDDMERGEYQYFQPAMTGDETGNPDSPYQDYQRMESLNRGDWQYLHTFAECEVQLTGSVCQTIRSGGLSGIESDSDDGYLQEVQEEEMQSLASELRAMGFSPRQIKSAFEKCEVASD